MNGDMRTKPSLLGSFVLISTIIANGHGIMYVVCRISHARVRSIGHKPKLMHLLCVTKAHTTVARVKHIRLHIMHDLQHMRTTHTSHAPHNIAREAKLAHIGPHTSFAREASPTHITHTTQSRVKQRPHTSFAHTFAYGPKGGRLWSLSVPFAVSF